MYSNSLLSTSKINTLSCCKNFQRYLLESLCSPKWHSQELPKKPSITILILVKQSPITTPCPLSLLFPQLRALTHIYYRKKRRQRRKPKKKKKKEVEEGRKKKEEEEEESVKLHFRKSTSQRILPVRVENQQEHNRTGLN